MENERPAGRAALTLLAALLAAGLSSAQGADMSPIRETFSQAHCAWLARDASLRLFENAAQWQTVFLPGQAAPFSHPPDWTRQLVVAFTLGSRPTTGFGVALGAQTERRHDTLWLTFKETVPAPGDMQQQALTQPCLFALLERGTWRHLVLRNAASGAEFRAAVSAIRPQ